MMFHSNSSNTIANAQGAKHSCSLLAVVCDDKLRDDLPGDRFKYPFPELASSGRLEVRTLSSPSLDEFRRTLESLKPNVVYLQGQLLSNDEIGSVVWGGGVDFSNVEAISELFDRALPTTVYLEMPNGEELADAIHFKGVPYVIFWRNAFSCYAASHFRHALFSVVQSSSCHTWDAFQLAHASFRLYCIRNNLVLPRNSQKAGGKVGPSLLGEPPTIDVTLPEFDAGDEEDSSGIDISAVKIHDDDVNVRFLICGEACSLDAYLLGCLEDGLNALLGIELRGSKLQNRFSAPPPPLHAGTFSRGVVTMRCDISTCSSTHISLLVSGSAQTCFDDQQLENHIKKEVVESCQLVQAVPSSEEIKLPSSDPRTSASIACGATVFEICLKAPSWAAQVLKQLAREPFYRTLVALGIASIQGLAVASFQKDDAARLLFFSSGSDTHLQNGDLAPPPRWLRPPPPSRNSSELGQPSSPSSHNSYASENQVFAATADKEDKDSGFLNGAYIPIFPIRKKLKVAAMRPIPHTNLRKMMSFLGVVQTDNNDSSQVKTNLSAAPATNHSVSTSNPAAYRRSSNTYQAKQIITLNPIPLKKHGCGRVPIHLCSEVVSRGGFHVGNGINWKGQIFSKMWNYTATNKMAVCPLILLALSFSTP